MTVANTREYNRRYYEAHKAEISEQHRRYREAHGVEISERMKRYREDHRAKLREHKKQFYQAHKLEESERRKLYRKAHREKILERDRRYYEPRRERRALLRRLVLTHYGDGKCACIKCGYDENIVALSIDHIHGNGGVHRRRIGKEGISFYSWLKKNGLPEGYQTLCMNCQFIKRIEEKEYRNARS